MHQFDDPDDMTPPNLFQEVAGLLASGFLRLERRSSCELTNAPSDDERLLRPSMIELSEVTGVNRIATVRLDFSNPLSHCSTRVNTAE